MSTGRCGYVFNLGTPLAEDKEACCWRPAMDGADRCVWHADEDKEDILTTPILPGPGEEFVETVFRGASLPGVTVFSGRTLKGSDLDETDLRYADLSEADLRDATVRNADLRHADLSGADLRDADFTDTDLREANLTDVDARGATFESANFENALFIRTNLRNASIENARLYQVSFSDTRINEGTVLGEQTVYETDTELSDLTVAGMENTTDIRSDEDAQSVQQNEAAAWTYRALERLCRANSMPEKTRWYYIREKEARRKQAWATGDYPYAIRAEGSRLVMEHGSNPWRIVGVSGLVIVLFAIIYPLTGGLLDTAAERTFGVFVEEPTDAPRFYFGTVFLKSLYFSAVTFATLGYGDIQPIGAVARMLATVETLMGSLLTALLVFVLARIVTW